MSQNWTRKRAILQDEIDKESAGHPQLIIIHTGTNDLTTTTPIDDFISDISVLITQASTKFPKSKIVYSTLLPRTDIPLHTLSKINTNLIDSCSKLPNVHLVNHENIFSKGTEVLHDRKHLKKRHLGLFAANLKAAIRGRGKPPRTNSSQLYRSSLSSSHSFHTSTSEGYPPSSNGVRNIHSQVHQTSRQQQPLPSRSHIQLPRVMPLIVMLLKTVTTPTTFRKTPQQQQNFPPQYYNVQSLSRLT